MKASRTRCALLAGAVGLTLTLVGTTAYAASSTEATSTSAAAGLAGQGSARAMEQASGMGTFDADQPFDLQFIDQMSIHHRGAIASTQAMIADSARPELKTLAEDIISTQRDQLTLMQNWRDQWYPDAAATSPMGGKAMMGGHAMMGGKGMMKMSGKNMMGGKASERMYLRMMIAHHQIAVDMGDRARAQAEHPELRELAATIAREQAAQIKQMRAYLAAA